MANEDILLTIGISIESVKRARQQIENEIKEWKVPEVGVIDEKSMKAGVRAAKEAIKEVNLAQKEITTPKPVATKDISSIKKISEVTKEVSSSSFLAKEQMKKLANTTAYYTEVAKTEGITLTKVNAERNAYLKISSSGIKLDAERATRLKELTALQQKLASSQKIQKQETPKAESYLKANEEIANLAKTTNYYKLKDAAMQQHGKNFSDIKSELVSYLKVEASGIQLDDNALLRKKQLTEQYLKLDKAQKGFFHGIDIPRLMLWAVGWKIMYGALNIVLNSFGEAFTAVGKLNEVILQSRVVNQQTAEAYSKDYDKIRNTIVKFSKNSTVSIVQLAEAFKTLTFEGAKVSTSLAALPNVRNLMVITGEKEKVVAQSLIETYGLFGDKVKSAGTESAQLARISDVLAAVFTKAHISLSEYQNLMGFIAPMAASMTESFEFLAGTLIFADEQMLGGRKAGMALMDTLAGLIENSGKLAKIFGIVFEPGEMISVEKVMDRIRASVKDLSDPQKRDLLSRIFKGAALEVVLNMLKKTNEEIASFADNSDGLGKKLAESFAQAHPALIALQNAAKDMAGFFAQAYNWAVKLESIAEKRLMKDLASGERKAKIAQYGKKNIVAQERSQEISTQFGQDIAFGRSNLPLPSESKKMVMFESVYTQELKSQLQMLDKKQQLSIAEAKGASFSYLQQQKLNIALEESVGFIDDETKKQTIITEILNLKDATAKSIYDVFAKNVDISKLEGEVLSSTNKILEEKYALQIKMAEETKALADDLQSKTTDFARNLMAGTGDIKGFLNGISDSFRETFANNLVQMFGEKTGIFASMASSFMSPISKAHYNGGKSIAPLIVKAHIDGIAAGFSKIQGNAPNGGGGGGAMGLMNTVAGYGSSSNPIDLGNINVKKNVAEAEIAGKGKVPVKPSNMQQLGKMAGQASAAIGLAYSTYQGIAAQKGKGAMTGGLGGAMTGAMAGAMFGPMGMLIGAAVGGIAGGILGNKKNKGPDPEIRTQTLEIKSAIQLSNKELQLVNRNLEGIKRGFEGFVFQRSAYFSESRAAEDFAADRSRGYIG